MIYINVIVVVLLLLSNFSVKENIQSANHICNNKRSFTYVKNDFSFKIDTFFTNKYRKGAFNGVVLFADSGRIIYENAFGYSKFSTKDSLKTNSIFQLASVSKQFTAFAVMFLKEKGMLSYNDDVRKYFPSFPYEGITIRHLLTHSSGLQNYMHFADDYWADKDQVLNNNNVIDILIKYKPELCFKPGARFLYCNTGYCILASIIEKVTGMPFNHFMESNIFKPLGMNNTFVFNSRLQLQNERIALGHSPGKRVEPWFYQDGVVGDKNVYSTVNDLLIWDQALYDCQLVNHNTLDEAFVPAFSKIKSDRNYGYGWRIKTFEGNKIVYHGGWWKGYRSYFVRSLNDHKTIIVLINTASHIPFRINDLLKMFGISEVENA